MRWLPIHCSRKFQEVETKILGPNHLMPVPPHAWKLPPHIESGVYCSSSPIPHNAYSLRSSQSFSWVILFVLVTEEVGGALNFAIVVVVQHITPHTFPVDMASDELGQIL